MSIINRGARNSQSWRNGSQRETEQLFQSVILSDIVGSRTLIAAPAQCELCLCDGNANKLYLLCHRRGDYFDSYQDR